MISSRKNLLLTALLGMGIFLISAWHTNAQSFEEGINYYHQKKYKQAIAVFNGIKNPQGYLFTGKSFYALGEYEQAQSNLDNIPADAAPQIRGEARYTSALVSFQEKHFGQSLAKLYQVRQANVNDDLTENAAKLYTQILGYLTASQRMEAIKEVSEGEIQFDILKSGMGKMQLGQAQKLYKAFTDKVSGDEWEKRGQRLAEPLGSVSSYRDEYGAADKKLQPPPGTVYNIGVALPKYGSATREFGIVKALYFGALLAADNFNQNHDTARAYIQFIDTGTSADDIGSKVRQFKKNRYGDAIIGPLFSDQAEPMVSLSTDLKIPSIAPLANSDIHAENSFLFQANPTFRIHGKAMADYAVNDLNMNNLAILANTDSKGAVSAAAFNEEAEKNGGTIEHYFIKNLQANKYDIAQYVQYFGSDKPIDAVYAPFTGSRAPALIDLLIANLKSMDSPITVLGSQEYRNLNFKSSKYNNVKLYFSESASTGSGNGKLRRFKNAYQRRFGDTGNKYSMIGYDITRFLLQSLDRVGNPDLLKQAIGRQRNYHGLIQDINFDGGNVNKAVKIMKVSPTGDTYRVN